MRVSSPPRNGNSATSGASPGASDASHAINCTVRSSGSQTFDVEPATQEFFRQYHATFPQVEELIRGIWDKDRERLYNVAVLQPLMFIAFIREKGWLQFGDHVSGAARWWPLVALEPFNAGPVVKAGVREAFHKADYSVYVGFDLRVPLLGPLLIVYDHRRG